MIKKPRFSLRKASLGVLDFRAVRSCTAGSYALCSLARLTHPCYERRLRAFCHNTPLLFELRPPIFYHWLHGQPSHSFGLFPRG